MPNPGDRLSHIWVRDRAENREFRRVGGGDAKVRDVEFRTQGKARHAELEHALDLLTTERAEALTEEELRALGVIVVLEGADAAFPLKVDSLERLSGHRKVPKRPKWLLLSVTPASADTPERAMVWISDEYRESFMKLFEDYLTRESKGGKPLNRELVANIGRIRKAVLDDLWQSEGVPPTSGTRWWELWLLPTADAVERLTEFAAPRGITVASDVLRLNDRTIGWVRASWAQLAPLPFTRVPLAEIREPEFVNTVEDLTRDDQDELTEDLADRITAARLDAPAVCHLDTGVMRSHALLGASLDANDMHTVVGSTSRWHGSHGTMMAGLALFGTGVEELLLNSNNVLLRHRLESVELLPPHGQHEPHTYGVVTAQAVALPEIVAPERARVFCMPITADPERPGEPTLWSASVDALAAGVDVGQSQSGIELIGAPNPDASRLFVISAGNVPPTDFQADYQAACDTAMIQDPAHSWNSLTVGAYTDLASEPNDPEYWGWNCVATKGDISPHSRTSLLFSRKWPIKPDICMEGGNVLTDGDDYDEHPLLSLRTSDTRSDLAMASVSATSAATAQAARLAALAQATYPEYWPETIRALLVHAAEWTPVMREAVDAQTALAARAALLRRYGWGVPTEEATLTSSQNAVTLVTQDEFVPFTGEDYSARAFRLHRLPWPEETLRELGAANVTLRVTLSYFIEPTAARRGWRRRYAYASHGLRFELKGGATESMGDFIRRVNHDAQSEEQGHSTPSTQHDWLIGPNQRNVGSLHQDVWEGSGAQLADAGVLAVHPVGGWWKNNRRKDRLDQVVRYALVVSLKTAEQGVDLYSPVAVELGTPIETMIEATG